MTQRSRCLSRAPPVAFLALILSALTTAAGSPAFSQGRRLEASPWVATPSSDNLRACSPAGVEPPRGGAVALCKVGPRGKLEECTFDRVVGGAAIRRWAACAVTGFTAKAELRGRMVEIPVEPIDEITQVLVEPDHAPDAR